MDFLASYEVDFRGGADLADALLFLLHREAEGVLAHILLPEERVEPDHAHGCRRPTQANARLSQEAGDENLL